LNLRKGGTAHPFLTLQFLADGTYDGERGVFLPPSGSCKYLVATDHFEDDRLKALTVPELFDVVVRHGLHFDQARRTGVVFHMISCLTSAGASASPRSGTPPKMPGASTSTRSQSYCRRPRRRSRKLRRRLNPRAEPRHMPRPG
jgi:hypothetical protein